MRTPCNELTLQPPVHDVRPSDVEFRCWVCTVPLGLMFQPSQSLLLLRHLTSCTDVVVVVVTLATIALRVLQKNFLLAHHVDSNWFFLWCSFRELVNRLFLLLLC